MIALVGVTASGKTSVACRIGADLDAEIVCCDAMTIYRGMDVGTAKPTSAQREAVPHHLLDLFTPGERPSVADVASAAAQAIAGIHARGKTPLVVGGSGLYLRAILDGLEFPPTDPVVRARLDALDPSEAIRRLRESDPDALAFVDAANRRRVVRALEVIELTGRRFSSFRDRWGARSDTVIVGLDVSDQTLRARIEHRTASMLDDGWEDECSRLEREVGRDAVLSTNAIGYGAVYGLIDGIIDRTEAAAAIERQTMKLTRRQMTWFRRDPRIVWVDAGGSDAATLGAAAYFRSQLATHTG